MNKSLMCHMVPGFPTQKKSMELIEGLRKIEISALEVQIPFSDPIADGEAIMEANDVALQNGMTIEKSFEFIKNAREAGFSKDIYIMSYAQKIQHFGFEKFCRAAEKSEVKGFIIPDMPFDTDDYNLELKVIARKHNIVLVPVLSPGMSETRLEKVLKTKPSVIYLTSMRGITGNVYTMSSELKDIAKKIKQTGSTTLMIGFGITTSEDVVDALMLGDVAVVGSAIVRSLQNSSVSETLVYIRSLVNQEINSEK